MSSSSARVDLLRGQHRLRLGAGSDAPPLLLKAARRLEPFDLELARETYLAAWGGAIVAGHLAARASSWRSAAPSGPSLRRQVPPRPLDLLLDGLALLATDGHAAAAPTLRRAAERLRQRRHPRGGSPAVGLDGRRRPSIAVWDYEGWHAISASRSSSSATPARSRSCRSTLLAWRIASRVDRRLRGGRRARSRRRRGCDGDREPPRALSPLWLLAHCEAGKPRPPR